MDFNFDFMEEDFFAVPKKEEKKERKPEKKAETGRKKGKTAQDKDFNVRLPVTVYARDFRKTVEGSGTRKISEILDELIQEGYDHLRITEISAAYADAQNAVYICDEKALPEEPDVSAGFSEEETAVTVAAGMMKSVFEAADFAGKSPDEISAEDVAQRFAAVHPLYEGCRLVYDAGSSLAYPKGRNVSDTDEVSLPAKCIVNGEEVTIGKEEEIKKASDLKKRWMKKDVPVEIKLQKFDSVYFISYGCGKAKEYKRSERAAARKLQKVQKRYQLPLSLYIVTWGMTYELVPEMFEGKAKVTMEEIKKVMGTQEKIFQDDSRKIDSLYDEERNLLSIMFVSGKKGADGIWKLIRSEEELEKVRAMDSYLGIYCERKDSFKMYALPHGNFFAYFGKEKECCEVVKVEFEKKFPRMPRSVLNGIIAYFRRDLSAEAIVKILFNRTTKEFITMSAKEKGGRTGISYEFEGSLLKLPDMIQIMEIHSHNTMPAYFSSTDDADESGYPGIFGVIGCLGQRVPEMRFRAGADGVFREYPVSYFFE